MLLFLYKVSVRGELRLMTTRFEEISKKNRYGYARVSSKEQAHNSSLEAQKTELIKLGVPEKIFISKLGPLLI